MPVVGEASGDPLLGVAVRVYANFAEDTTIPEVLAVVGQCRRGQMS